MLVWPEGWKQAGFAPVILSDEYLKTVDIMLISDEPAFSFADARWDVAKAHYPFLESDVDDTAVPRATITSSKWKSHLDASSTSERP